MGFVVPHPFHDETVEWMGHAFFVGGSKVRHPAAQRVIGGDYVALQEIIGHHTELHTENNATSVKAMIAAVEV